MKRRLIIILICVIIFAGVGLLLYPTISNIWNEHAQTIAVVTYAENIKGMDKQTIDSYKQKASIYNQELRKNIERWTMSDEDIQKYGKQLDFSLDGTMGYVEIPKIKVLAPIYHGTSDSVLQKGIGHIRGSSLPIGGNSTHAAISGHTGLPSAKLLTELHKLEIGDEFYINVLEDTLVYRVDQILVVEPEDMSGLKIEENKDYCTIVTCTPYGINSHRLLVRGQRVYVDIVPQDKLVDDLMDSNSSMIYVIIIVSAVFVLVVLIVFIFIKKKRKTQLINEDTNEIDNIRD